MDLGWDSSNGHDYGRTSRYIAHHHVCRYQLVCMLSSRRSTKFCCLDAWFWLLSENLQLRAPIRREHWHWIDLPHNEHLFSQSSTINRIQNGIRVESLRHHVRSISAWHDRKLTRCSYNRYLAIAARVVRRSLKDGPRVQAERRGEMDLRFAKWTVSLMFSNSSTTNIIAEWKARWSQESRRSKCFSHGRCSYKGRIDLTIHTPCHIVFFWTL